MIAIDFNQSSKAFAVGGSISGLVRWSQLLTPAESLEIRLVWYTKGKGDRDISVVDQRTLQTSQPEGQTEFEFPVPPQPYSFSGKLISLVWAVEVVCFPGSESESIEIVIGPSGKEVLLYRGEGAT